MPEVRYDAATALLVVDVQNDFADPGGGLYVRDGESVVTLANEQVTAAQNAGAAVVYTQDWHPASTPHFEKDGGIWPVHCVATRGAPSCTRTCSSTVRWSARARPARTATPASPCATR